jgi:hypothetical protein
MTSTHRFARVTFAAAGLYGLVAMIPQYWLEERIGRDTPPPITHVEYFYGFIGVVIAWQLVFLLIARNPVALRALMPIAVIEKLAFAVPVIILYAQHRITGTVLGFGQIDLLLAALFTTSYLLTPRASRRIGARP